MFQLCLLITTFQLSLIATQDLKTIFHTPRRNYDDLEILERSNFRTQETSSAAPSDKPQAYANAQVMLRFGGGDKEKCACGDTCRCRETVIPYYIPVLTPLPYFVCAPPTPKPDDVSAKVVHNENVVDEREKEHEKESNNHPEILKTVELSNEVIEQPDHFSKVKCLEEVSNKLEPTEVSANVKFLSLDLSKAPVKSDLDKCLVPYSSPKQQIPKLLVTYPIFNKDESVKPPVQYYQSGYHFSEGSGHYSDPSKTVVYRKPTVLTIIGPHSGVVSDPGARYVLVPVRTPVQEEHDEDCCCCSCAKYVGELNQQEA